MKSVLFAVIFALAAVMVVTAGTQAENAGPQHETHNMSMMQMMQNCPMKVPGADIAVADTENGVAVTITTKTGDVADLRRRTESMAKMHSAESNKGMHGQMMPFDVKYEEIADGARLSLTPRDAARLEEFRTKVRQHVEQMKKGDCSMMQEMMQGMMGGATPKPEPKPNTEEDHSAHHPGGEGK
jgi:hypothetical protein